MTFLYWWLFAGVAVFLLSVHLNFREGMWTQGLSLAFWVCSFFLCLALWPFVLFELVAYL